MSSCIELDTKIKVMDDKSRINAEWRIQQNTEYSRIQQNTAEYSRIQQNTAEYGLMIEDCKFKYFKTQQKNLYYIIYSNIKYILKKKKKYTIKKKIYTINKLFWPGDCVEGKGARVFRRPGGSRQKDSYQRGLGVGQIENPKSRKKYIELLWILFI